MQKSPILWFVITGRRGLHSCPACTLCRPKRWNASWSWIALWHSHFFGLVAAEEQQQAPRHFCGKNSTYTCVVELWCEFNNISAYEPMLLEQADEVGEIRPKKSSRFWGTCSRQNGRIKPVQINGDVDRAALEGGKAFAQSIHCWHQAATVVEFLEFRFRSTADGELEEVAAGQDLEAAAHGTGVAVMAT